MGKLKSGTKGRVVTSSKRVYFVGLLKEFIGSKDVENMDSWCENIRWERFFCDLKIA
jgi:hypothetical protein